MPSDRKGRFTLKDVINYKYMFNSCELSLCVRFLEVYTFLKVYFKVDEYISQCFLQSTKTVQISTVELLTVVHASVHDKIFERNRETERGQRVEKKKESGMFVSIIFHKRCL